MLYHQERQRIQEIMGRIMFAFKAEIGINPEMTLACFPRAINSAMYLLIKAGVNLSKEPRYINLFCRRLLDDNSGLWSIEDFFQSKGKSGMLFVEPEGEYTIAVYKAETFSRVFCNFVGEWLHCSGLFMMVQEARQLYITRRSMPIAVESLRSKLDPELKISFLITSDQQKLIARCERDIQDGLKAIGLSCPYDDKMKALLKLFSSLQRDPQFINVVCRKLVADDNILWVEDARSESTGIGYKSGTFPRIVCGVLEEYFNCPDLFVMLQEAKQLYVEQEDLVTAVKTLRTHLGPHFGVTDEVPSDHQRLAAY